MEKIKVIEKNKEEKTDNCLMAIYLFGLMGIGSLGLLIFRMCLSGESFADLDFETKIVSFVSLIAIIVLFKYLKILKKNKRTKKLIAKLTNKYTEDKNILNMEFMVIRDDMQDLYECYCSDSNNNISNNLEIGREYLIEIDQFSDRIEYVEDYDSSVDVDMEVSELEKYPAKVAIIVYFGTLAYFLYNILINFKDDIIGVICYLIGFLFLFMPGLYLFVLIQLKKNDDKKL